MNAAREGIRVNITRFQEACAEYGHHQPLMTPPYHPELQPIEELWRDVKQYVARKFAGTRTMTDLREHVQDGFRKYGTAQFIQQKVGRAREMERKYREEGVFAPVIDLTELSDSDGDDDLIADDDDSSDDNDNE